MAETPGQFFRRLKNSIPQLEQEILRDVVLVEAKDFHAKNFRKGGFTDVTFEKWKPRITTDKPGKKRGMLVQSAAMKGHALAGKIRGKQVDFNFPLAYMKIHNEGGKIPVTDKMRKFFWAKYRKTKQEHWKSLALTKKSHIDMPKRQYVGKSTFLENKIRLKAIKLLNRKLK